MLWHSLKMSLKFIVLFYCHFFLWHFKIKASHQFNSKCQTWHHPSVSMNPSVWLAVVVVCQQFSYQHLSAPNKCHWRKIALTVITLETAVWHHYSYHCCVCRHAWVCVSMGVCEHGCVCVCVLLGLLMKCWQEEGLGWGADFDKCDTNWVKVSMNKPTQVRKCTQRHTRSHTHIFVLQILA